MDEFGQRQQGLAALRHAINLRLLMCAMTCLAASVASGQPLVDERGDELHRLPRVETIAAGPSVAFFDSANLSANLSDEMSGEVFASDGQQFLAEQELTRRVQTLESVWEGQWKEELPAADATEKSSRPTLRVIGRVNLDSWFYPHESPGVNAFETGDPAISPQDRWGFRRLRFGAVGDILENMHYKVELEFAGGNATVFRDAYLGFTELPWQQTLLIGNQKRPYGLDFLNSGKYNVFMERPFVVEGFNPLVRRLGVCAHGFSEDEAWNWRYGVFNRDNQASDAGYVSDHFQAEVAGRLANTIWYDESSQGRGYAHWAIAGSYGNPDGTVAPGAAPNSARFGTRPEAHSSNRWLDTLAIAGASSYQLIGLEGVVNVGAWQVVGEYQHLRLQRDAGFGDDLQFGGGYVYAAYFLTGEHMPWNRRSGTLGRVKPLENFFLVNTCDSGVQAGRGGWQVAVRYSYADFSDDNIFGGIGESVTLGLNWWWTPYSRLQFNYLHGRITDHFAVAGQTAGDYEILGASVMVDF